MSHHDNPSFAGVNGLRVHTARISYGGPDRLDITRKSGTGLGLVFAPSWDLLKSVIDARALANVMRERFERERQASVFQSSAGDRRLLQSTLEQADAVERAAWAAYVPAYVEEMRQSYRLHRRKWEALLGWERVVLCCCCSDAKRCYRRILAEILGKLGATDEGEIVGNGAGRDMRQ